MGKPKPKEKPSTRTPGVETEAPGAGSTVVEYDDDAAVDAGQAGGTHKVAKNHPRVERSKVRGDPQRPPDAAVNAKKEMAYDEAMAMLGAETETKELQEERSRLREESANLGDAQDEQERKTEILDRTAQINARIAELAKLPRLTRSVLTEKGWVTPPGRVPPTQARV